MVINNEHALALHSDGKPVVSKGKVTDFCNPTGYNTVLFHVRRSMSIFWGKGSVHSQMQPKHYGPVELAVTMVTFIICPYSMVTKVQMAIEHLSCGKWLSIVCLLLVRFNYLNLSSCMWLGATSLDRANKSYKDLYLLSSLSHIFLFFFFYYCLFYHSCPNFPSLASSAQPPQSIPTLLSMSVGHSSMFFD